VELWLEQLALDKRWAQLVWTCIRHLRWLRRWTPTWGILGFVLLHVGWARWCARWLGDWANRSDLEPWMLLNLVNSLWIAKGGRGADQVARLALRLPSDRTSARHRVWSLFQRALDGDARAACAELVDLPAGTELGAENGLVPMIRVLAAAEAPEGTDEASAVELLRQSMQHARRATQLGEACEAMLRTLRRHRDPGVRRWMRAAGVGAPD
jgi:hypothetical protein